MQGEIVYIMANSSKIMLFTAQYDSKDLRQIFYKLFFYLNKIRR